MSPVGSAGGFYTSKLLMWSLRTAVQTQSSLFRGTLKYCQALQEFGEMSDETSYKNERGLGSLHMVGPQNLIREWHY